MELSGLFWNASLEELKQGYIQKKDTYICLLCGERYEKGIVYPHEGMFYEAERYMRIHIEEVHGSVFAYLIGLDKKLTGLYGASKQSSPPFLSGKKRYRSAKGTRHWQRLYHPASPLRLKRKGTPGKNFFGHYGIVKRKRPAFPCLYSGS